MIQHEKNRKAFIDYSQTIDDVYENLEDCDLTKQRKLLIAFGDMIADKGANTKKSPTDTELFVRGRKLNISLVFISQSYFKMPKDIRLNATHYLIIKIPNKRELQQIESNHSPGDKFKDFMKLYKDYTKERFLFLVNDAILPSHNPLRFRRNLFKNDC